MYGFTRLSKFCDKSFILSKLSQQSREIWPGQKTFVSKPKTVTFWANHITYSFVLRL